MELPYFKVKRLNSEVKLPSKREEDAGFDLYGFIEEEYLILKPGEIYLFPTKLSIEIPKNWVLNILERGSTGTKGISTRCGVIDSGYRGEIFIPINNTSNKNILFYTSNSDPNKIISDLSLKEIISYPLSKAIAQGLLLYCPHVEIIEEDNLNLSLRGEGKLGSSNK